MNRIIHNLALGAAFIVLIVSLWQDWGTLSTIKRMVTSYLGFFFLGSVMALAVKLVGVLETNQANDLEGAENSSSSTTEV